MDYNKILDFWLNEIGPKGWYDSSETLDAKIRDHFQQAWQEALDGNYVEWTQTAKGCLGYLILTDQFPRNMFRGDGKSFATDHLALQVSKSAITKKLDMDINTPERQFVYLPFCHSEKMENQKLALDYMSQRMGGDQGNARHAKVHMEIIKKFGRFPYRNNALGRETTAAEQKFLDNNGYQTILNSLPENE